LELSLGRHSNLTTILIRIRQIPPWVLVFVCAAVALAAYIPTLDYPFVYDDIWAIPQNHKLQALHLTELWRLLAGPYNVASEFLPLRDLSFWFDMTLFGLKPFVFRFHNIILYLLCLPLVYGNTLWLWRYFRTKDSSSARWAAAVATALFAMHPVLVESVVYISGLKYMLPNLLAMLALWFAINAKQEKGISATYASAALVAFVTMMMSKASYVTVAPVIAMLWGLFWFDIPMSSRRRSHLLWPVAILCLAMLLVLIFIDNSAAREPAYFGIEVITRTLAVLGWLTRLAVSPESHHFVYPVFEDPYLPWMIVLGAVVLAAAAICAVIFVRKRSLEGFALVTFLLLCMPYIQLIPYAPPTLVSDRFLTLAVWPVMVLLVALAWRLKPAPRTIILLAIALPLGFQTLERPRDWRSIEALVDSDLRAFPGFYMPALYKIQLFQVPNGSYREALETAYNVSSPEARNILIKLIQGYSMTADTLSTGDPREAMDRLLDLSNDLGQAPADAHWNTPLMFFWGVSQNMLADLIEYLAKTFPEDELVQFNAGSWMLHYAKFENAVVHLRAATESPRLPANIRGTAFKNLGIALIGFGDPIGAEAPLRTALEQSSPDFQAYCYLSDVYKQKGQVEESVRAEAECDKLVPLGERITQ
jgi:hypothetical protein